MTSWDPTSVELRTDVPHPARMYDYYLGGKDNYPADREAAEAVLAAEPMARIIALENRGFLRRAVRHLVRDRGVRQFIDIGTGLPTAKNVHEVAQELEPETRIVYVDNDPIVLRHAQALMDPNKNTRVVLGDITKPRDLVNGGALDLIDFERPVALLLIAVLHFVPDHEDPRGIVEYLLSLLPSGSYLALSHASGDLEPETASTVAKAYEGASSSLTVRSHDEITNLFEGCELVEPGLVNVSKWRPERPHEAGDEKIWIFGGVGRKP
jgi:S-adenosyl methyltransferase